MENNNPSVEPDSVESVPQESNNKIQEKKQTPKKKKSNDSLVIKYIFFIIGFTIIIGFFSVVMAGVSSYRNSVTLNNYDSTADIYHGPIEQRAPELGTVQKEYIIDDVPPGPGIGQDPSVNIVNTFLRSTDADVLINADFVKKGLSYQPSYQTSFEAVYILENDSEEPEMVRFEFPFPVSVSGNEISNVRLIVDGEEIKDAKTTISSGPDQQYSYPYDSYTETDGLAWEGELEGNSEIDIKVSYDTVGLSAFDYQGLENSKGSQDFYFTMKIVGTKSYDVISGLSVDERIFTDEGVELVWSKPDLYSTPELKVAIGSKLNPSTQVSRVYLTMAPLYFVLTSILVYLAYRFGKRKLTIFDLLLFTILFILYFPLVHYLSSFTLDPTIDSVSFLNIVEYYSMPIYGAFLIAGIVIGSLMLYLLAKISGKRFALKYGLPLILLFLGFFPLVVTIPEYSMLLVLFGATALTAIIIKVRVNMVNKQKEAELSN